MSRKGARKGLRRAFALAAAALVILLAAGMSTAGEPGRKAVTFYEDGRKNGCTFTVELALTPEEQEKGLMYRRSLDPDGGMLFIFDRDEIRSFWMRNTLIPLDMVFVNSSMKVVSIYEFAKPGDETGILSGAPARYVLEVNGGRTASCRIKPGMKMKVTGR